MGPADDAKKQRRIRIVTISFLVVFSASLVLFAVSISHIFEPTNEEGIYCDDALAIDGNTLRIPSGCFRNAAQLRLIGVDAPERSECGGLVAKDELSRLVDGQEIQLVLDSSVDPIDQKGRATTRVEVGDGQDVGLKMILAGRAKVGDYDGQFTGRIRMYRHAQELAREQNRGIWRECPR